MRPTKLHSDEKGASSILVIVMMVVLLVFGLAVLTTSLSNLRLSQRKKAWLSEYYQLESVASKQIATIDALLIDVNKEAIDYLASEAYVEDYMLEGPVVGPAREQIFSLIYNDLLTEKFLEVIKDRDDMAFYHNEPDLDEVMNGKLIPSSRLEFNVQLPKSNYEKHLHLSMALLGANTDNINEHFSVIERYRILRHTQEQEAFNYDSHFDFDNPFEEENPSDNPFEE